MGPAEVERKMNQFEHDVRDIHTILHEIAGTQRRHGNRFNELAGVLDEHTLTLAVHSDRLRSLDDKVDKVDVKVDKLDDKVDTVIHLLQERRSDGGS